MVCAHIRQLHATGFKFLGCIKLVYMFLSDVFLRSVSVSSEHNCICRKELHLFMALNIAHRSLLSCKMEVEVAHCGNTQAHTELILQ